MVGFAFQEALIARFQFFQYLLCFFRGHPLLRCFCYGFKQRQSFFKLLADILSQFISSDTALR